MAETKSADVENHVSGWEFVKITRGEYSFYATEGAGDSEVSGCMDGPNGFVKKLSGWYRTTDPDVAAEHAFLRLADILEGTDDE